MTCELQPLPQVSEVEDAATRCTQRKGIAEDCECQRKCIALKDADLVLHSAIDRICEVVDIEVDGVER